MFRRIFLEAPPLGVLLAACGLLGCGSYDSGPDAAAGAPPVAGSPGLAGSSGLAGAPSPGGSPGVGGASGGSVGGTSGGSPQAEAGLGGAGGGRQPPPEPSCENVVACGGELEGVWFAQASCLPVTGIADLSELGIGCTEASISSGEITVSGNWTIAADGTLSDNTNTIAEVVFELAPGCKEVSGTVTNCNRIGIPLAAGGFDDVQCVDSTAVENGCTCTGTVNQMGGMGHILGFNAATAGTYTSANNTLTVSGTSSAELAYPYCVNGEFMTASPATKLAFGTTNGTVVFQKQP